MVWSPVNPGSCSGICPEETKALVWCGLLFVLEISVRVCGMLFSGMSLYFRTSLKAVYTDPWLVKSSLCGSWTFQYPALSWLKKPRNLQCILCERGVGQWASFREFY